MTGLAELIACYELTHAKARSPFERSVMSCLE